jgi:hypothetical protein
MMKLLIMQFSLGPVTLAISNPNLSAAMFLTRVSPASPLDGSSRRISIEYKVCRGSRLATYYSKALKIKD